MNKKKFEELTQLYFLDELTDAEKTELENYILEDEAAKFEFESIRKLHSALVTNRPDEISEEKIFSMREDLFAELKPLEQKYSLLDKITDWFSEFMFLNYRLATGGIAILLLGIVLGRYAFNTSTTEQLPGQSLDNFSPAQIEAQGLNISNIKFSDSFTKDGNIEFKFDAVKPVKYVGNTDDVFVQQLLARALLTAENPGLRIRTVNTLSEFTEGKKQIDPKVKSALISSVIVDENPAVRREALNALARFKFDNEIRDAVLNVLEHDDNSGLRVLAINILADRKLDDKNLDKVVEDVLNRKAAEDESGFIKLRAASILKEVN